ncbi:uncharacterized protein LOC126846533 isoform X1 [Adelges cooleyi]|uniref:uncharacterized protein LOC126846533 isoform X1 n=1 Tax=Adelges cooleyi TaxID=133065 RepID=UPI0021804633|nr:uncharacterized protein LOC126846533 isoform X1 [Adelges cooleyi]
MAKLAFLSAFAAVALLAASAVQAVPVEASSDGKTGDSITAVQPEVVDDVLISKPDDVVKEKPADVQKPSAKQEIDEVPQKPTLQTNVRPQQFPSFNPQWFPLPQQQSDMFYSPFPMFNSPFNRLFQAYNQEFRAPEVIIINPKATVSSNRTSVTPIPLLISALLNAFRPEPTGILSQFEKELTDFDDITKTDTDEVEPSLPANKTTTRTEIIDGHVVQINETTYSSGDDNNKSFFHFKKIHVLPQEPLPQQPEDKKPDPVHPSVATDSVSPSKIIAEPLTVNDRFQAAATSYRPYAPYNMRPLLMPYQPNLYHNRGQGHGPSKLVLAPAGAVDRPVSLVGDTMVNDLAFAQQQASGLHQLPPDVEIIDVHGKPQRGNQESVPYYYNTIENSSQKKSTKFPGYKY